MSQSVTRLLDLSDVEELTELLRVNRDFLKPWSPAWDDEFFTVERQQELAEEALRLHHDASMVPWVICDEHGRIAGRLNLNGIVRGALQSAAVGYWVGEQFNAQGLATAAVAEAVVHSREVLGLHRLQAETLVHNIASQRVLETNGFSRYGMAQEYLKIEGVWQDHLMYQRILF
ncbi:GNAT family N-acetyltransferase [Nesterenkonia cremea]|uniref:Ribosomal-protein-alanine N-acetyltransferase n=1 Tax=Nesterenkonia cremea TaxID=1882340 RepID=A0A917ANA8_9MICC|nr:GNAT family N-acetyltransferase [Nesterenkonia cremea]GGE62338.1 ribosomal-protein-alanine N-acetyltransferase [Nesterenkonia cremea]